jgi:cbb3-type cytochrome oxidase subunit 3
MTATQEPPQQNNQADVGAIRSFLIYFVICLCLYLLIGICLTRIGSALFPLLEENGRLVTLPTIVKLSLDASVLETKVLTGFYSNLFTSIFLITTLTMLYQKNDINFCDLNNWCIALLPSVFLGLIILAFYLYALIPLIPILNQHKELSVFSLFLIALNLFLLCSILFKLYRSQQKGSVNKIDRVR